ncbi:MAG: 4-oxalocrotonate decarboxylase [Bacteroidetes bacterium]|nr:4-oxalocrotonate decarboxylase [Bacteroidota bacterium]
MQTGESLTALAEIVDTAALQVKATDQLSLNHSFTEKDAYEIQRISIDRRFERGEKLIGLKLGFTSYAKMEQMGVHDMIWGRLTDTMLFENGSTVDLSRFIHPRIEPEICFRISKTADREISRDEVLEYIDAIAPAMEIIDSRYQNFKFSLEDVIADNCSSAGLVVGEWQTPPEVLEDLKMTMSFDDEVVESGSSDDILGDPYLSVVNAIRLGLKYNEPLKAGHILMAGAATPAVFMKPETLVRTTVQNLGTVEVKS